MNELVQSILAVFKMFDFFFSLFIYYLCTFHIYLRISITQYNISSYFLTHISFQKTITIYSLRIFLYLFICRKVHIFFFNINHIYFQ